MTTICCYCACPMFVHTWTQWAQLDLRGMDKKSSVTLRGGELKWLFSYQLVSPVCCQKFCEDDVKGSHILL